jgi:hypothetical protein
VESAWAWNRTFSTVQYIQNPNDLIPGQPDWLTYLPPTSSNRVVRSLFTLQGDHSYLIKLADSAGTVTWTIRGQPSVRNVNWLPDSLNFVGFHVDPAAPPKLQSFFFPSSAQAGQLQLCRRLSPTGLWTNVNVSVATLSRGEALWIQSAGPSSYSGPLGIVFEQGHSVDYGRSLIEQTLTIQNPSTNARAVTITQLDSGVPPAGFARLAGPVPLSYWQTIFPTNFGFVPLLGALSNTIAAGGTWAIRLAVRRPDMAPPPSDPTGMEPLYQSILQVSDGQGMRWLVPVSARGMQSAAASISILTRLDGTVSGADADPHAGLWVGNALINQVNQPASLSNNTNPLATATEFQMRLILHVDSRGQARLLQKVLFMWKNGTYTNDASGTQVMSQPGHYVLVTDDALIAQFTGSAVRDGQPVPRRISTTAFALDGPLALGGNGSFGMGGSIFVCTNVLSYTNRLNPFLHRYHPDHNNLDERFEQVLPEGFESFTVSRQIQLQFTASDPGNFTMAGWGDNEVGGAYSETITGLHKNTLYVAGTFRLRHASTIGVLNDGLE